MSHHYITVQFLQYHHLYHHYIITIITITIIIIIISCIVSLHCIILHSNTMWSVSHVHSCILVHIYVSSQTKVYQTQNKRAIHLNCHDGIITEDPPRRPVLPADRQYGGRRACGLLAWSSSSLLLQQPGCCVPSSSSRTTRASRIEPFHRLQLSHLTTAPAPLLDVRERNTNIVTPIQYRPPSPMGRRFPRQWNIPIPGKSHLITATHNYHQLISDIAINIIIPL